MPSARICYWFAVSGYFCLLILLLLWNTVLAPSTRFPIAMTLIVSLVPLLFPLRGLLHGRLSSCTWAAYLSLFYFIHGVMEVAAVPNERLFSSLEILFSLLLLFGCAFYVQQSKKH